MGHGASISRYPHKYLHSDEDNDLILLRAVLGISSGRYFFLEHVKHSAVYQSLIEWIPFHQLFHNTNEKCDTASDSLQDEIKTEIVLLLLMCEISGFKESRYYTNWVDLENDPGKCFNEDISSATVQSDSALCFLLERHSSMRDTFMPPHNWVASIIKIFKHSPVPFAIVDMKGDEHRVIDVNVSLLTLTQYREEDIITSATSQFCPRGTWSRLQKDMNLKEVKDSQFRTTLIDARGNHIDVVLNLTTLYDEDQLHFRVILLYPVNRDDTDFILDLISQMALLLPRGVHPLHTVALIRTT